MHLLLLACLLVRKYICCDSPGDKEEICPGRERDLPENLYFAKQAVTIGNISRCFKFQQKLVGYLEFLSVDLARAGRLLIVNC